MTERAVDTNRYAEIAAREALRQDGVVRMSSGITERLGLRKTPGVAVHAGREGRLHFDLSIIVRDGVDLRQLAIAIQDAVIAAMGEASSPAVAQVNVRVAEIERNE